MSISELERTSRNVGNLSFQFFHTEMKHINPWRYSSDEPWPAEQPPLAVFPDCTRRYWVDM
jgi:hypothetical protein